MSFETKAEFGVTFNPKMSSKQASDLWFNEVAPEIRDDPKYADLNNQMLQCKAEGIATLAKQLAYEVQQRLLDIEKAAVELAAAIANGILSLPAAIAAKIAALLDLNFSIDLAATCKQQLHVEIDKIVEEHLPDQSSSSI